MKVYDQKTDHLREPLAIDHPRPVFGWKVSGEERDIYQEEYRLLVWDEEGRIVWDSGSVASSRMEVPYEGRDLISGERLCWNVECVLRSASGKRRIRGEKTFFEMGLLEAEDWKGSFIGETEDRIYHLYRKRFSCHGKLRKAKLYVCGLGHFECWLNGRRISDHVLEPGWSDYRKTCFYTAYSVTELIRGAEGKACGPEGGICRPEKGACGPEEGISGPEKGICGSEGENLLLVKLGDGMFNVPGGRYVYYERSYGKCKLLIQLELYYEGGGKELVVTDSSWEMGPSPIRFCCMYGGEDYDGRWWRKDYLMGKTQNHLWEPAKLVEPPRGKLKAMPMEPMKVMRTYSPVKVSSLGEGEFLYDFGTNFSGWVRIRLRTDGRMAGKKVVLRPGEILNEAGRVDQRVTGQGYAWTYFLNEEEEQEFAPDFTYTGFRYLEVAGAMPETAVSAAVPGEVEAMLETAVPGDVEAVSGPAVSAAVAGEMEARPEMVVPGKVEAIPEAAVSAAVPGEVEAMLETAVPGDVEAVSGPAIVSAPASSGGSLPVLADILGEFLYPDVEAAGEFTCSNSLFNSIHGIVLQAIYSNTKSYFTDCPHRERLGWLEQTHLIGPSIMYNLDVHNLYRKVEQDMADAQRDNGLVPDVCPEYVTGFEQWHTGFVDSPEWGSAAILNPWYVYRRYGDQELLERSYDVMKKYAAYLGSRTHHEVLHHGLGDWLDIGPCKPHSQNTPVPLTATCIYYYDLKVLERIAGLLGKRQEEKEWREKGERVFREYNLQFLDNQTGRYATGSQTAQAMSLMVGLVPKEMEEAAVKALKEDVVKRHYAVTAGDVGHPFLVAALMKYAPSLLNAMTNQTETPGYGYQVANGATTLTEEWDGPAKGSPHGSQNHLMLGSIEEWFYGGLGGMELFRNDLPLEEIRICPRPEEGVDWVKAWTMHPYGKICVEWRREGSEVRVRVQIPPNVTAHLLTPDQMEVSTVGSGRHEYSFTMKDGSMGGIER